MGKIYVEKKNTVQEEMAYIIYMIIRSFFNKAVCRNGIIEERLYMYYMEMRDNKQVNKEIDVIRRCELVLRGYREELDKMNCEVWMKTEAGKYLLDFITGFEEVHAEIDVNGDYRIQVQDARGEVVAA